MTRLEIFETVQALLRERFKQEIPLELDSRLISDLRLDSIDQLALVVELENRFEVCFEPDHEETLETLGDLVELVARLQGR